jgi:UDP-galactopyranose mutase
MATAARPSRPSTSAAPLLCLSHLRWNFVFQRPQHLMIRHARRRRVLFVEEPRFEPVGEARLETSTVEGGVTVAVPVLAEREPDAAVQRKLVDDLLAAEGIRDPVLWYYTPMALPFTRHLRSSLVVYDCMDELSAFRGAPPALLGLERELLERADVVFTGGVSLYEAKRRLHPNVHAAPSSVEVEHFARARTLRQEPADQAALPHPRLGFYGVIDERMDLDLLAGVADARPEWQIVLVGPVVKIEPEALPRRANLHYLGQKTYADLPGYLSGWDVALLPFARNEATRYISPTKTPEYLAAGRPVVSTSVRDVVRPYGEEGLVRVADSVPDFVAAAEKAMAEDAPSPVWRARVDARLAEMSWDRTWERMEELMEAAQQRRVAAR